MVISPSEFEQLVEEALASLPKKFADLLDNVAIVVEEEPSDDDLEILDGEEDDGSELLGIYRGTALPYRTHDMLPALPDTIAIFRRPILRVTGNRREAVRQIRETVIHELGHYFGLSDEDMHY
jgi:predicted Zn-dependent protease with MMP-like domain